MHTPWGESHNKVKIITGVNFYSTARHGGYKVFKRLNNLIPENLRNENCWYEEDVEFCIPYIFIPELKQDLKTYNAAIYSFKNFYPDDYEKVFNTKLIIGESYKRDQETFYKRNVNNWVGISAIKVSDDKVKVVASIGGKRGNDIPKKEFFVDADEYKNRSQFGYVITN